VTARSYLKGRRFEYRVVQDLRRRGLLAFRLPASRPFDVIAVDRKGQAYVIECKWHRRDFSEEERQALLLLRQRFKVRALLAYNEEGRIRYEVVR